MMMVIGAFIGHLFSVGINCYERIGVPRVMRERVQLVVVIRKC